MKSKPRAKVRLARACRLLLPLCLMLLAFAADAPSQVISGGGGGGGLTTINIKDYCGLPTGGGDASACINQAFSQLRVAQNGVGEIAFPPSTNGAAYVVQSPINCTGLTTGKAVIRGSGAWIAGQTTGLPVFDCLGSKNLIIRDLYIYGNVAANAPNIGIQIGRNAPAASQSAGAHTIINLTTYGQFTLAGVLNEAAEETTFITPYIANFDQGANAHAYIVDGTNHWNVASSFVAVTLPLDTAQSNVGGTLIGGSVAMGGASPLGTPLWFSNAAGHHLLHTFTTNNVSNGTGTQSLVTLWSNGTANEVLKDLRFDFHGETNPASVFLLSGANTAPTINGLVYRDELNQATGSVFKLDAGVTSATINDADVHIPQFVNAINLWDTAANYTVAGDFFLPAGSTAMGTPAALTGRVCLGPVCSNNPATKLRIFTSTNSGTVYTATTGAKLSCLTLVGPGGGGGQGSKVTSGTAVSGGSGGGGGGRTNVCLPSSAVTGLTMTLGAGGLGGTGAVGNSSPGATGAASVTAITQFGPCSGSSVCLQVFSGGGGQGGANGASSGGGAGGANSAGCAAGGTGAAGTGGTNACGGSSGGSGGAGVSLFAGGQGVGGGGGQSGLIGVRGGFGALNATGGGSGGGLASTPVGLAGGTGAPGSLFGTSPGGAAGTNNGSDGYLSAGGADVGSGAGGGGSNAAGNAGNGGVGAQCGGGGGGGGSVLNANTPGNGGNGGTACLIVTEYF